MPGNGSLAASRPRLPQGSHAAAACSQEFWRSFYRPITELPLRYHAHQNLQMNRTEWQKVRVIHMISGFRRRNRAPDFVFKRMRYFGKESPSWAPW